MSRIGAKGWRPILARYLVAGRGLARLHGEGQVHGAFEGELWRAREGGSSRPSPLAFCPPEWALGERSGDARRDALGDQFAFCAALWHALEGRLPFAGDSLEAQTQARASGELEAFGRPDLPQRLRFALVRGLAPRPEQRFASMDELLDELEGATGRGWGRRPRGLVGASLLVALLGAGASLGVWGRLAPREERAAGIGRAQAEVQLGRALVEGGWEALGLDALRRAVRELDALLGPGDERAVEARLRLGFGLLLADRHGQALEVLDRAARSHFGAGRGHDGAHLDLLRYRTVALSELGRCAQARALMDGAREWTAAEFGAGSVEYGQATLYRAYVCGWSSPKAAALAGEAVDVFASHGEALRLTRLAAQLEGGLARLVAGELPRARRELEAVRGALEDAPTRERSRRVRGLELGLGAGLALLDYKESPSAANAARVEAFVERGPEFRFRTRPLLRLLKASAEAASVSSRSGEAEAERGLR